MRAILLALLLLPLSVGAGDVALDWTNPTEQESCTNAGATTIDGVNIWRLVATLDYPANTWTDLNLKPGTYTYAATAFNADGESRNSGHTTKTVTSFVTVDSTEVFYPIPQNNGLLMLHIGDVPLGTPCNPDLEVNGHHAVDRALVTWTGTAQPLLVVAKCG